MRRSARARPVKVKVEDEDEDDDRASPAPDSTDNAGDDDNELFVPSWLPAVLPSERHRFFAPCEHHSLRKRNERVFFSTYSHESLCQHCCAERNLTSGSADAREDGAVRIRRYVYSDVLDRGDAMRHCMECENVQPYVLNGQKVIFLASRGNGRGGNGSSGNLAEHASQWSCNGCNRTLKDRFHYCSVECMLRIARKHAAAGTGFNGWGRVEFDGGAGDGYMSTASLPEDSDGTGTAAPPPPRGRAAASRVRARRPPETKPIAGTKRGASSAAVTSYVTPWPSSSSRRKKMTPCRAPLA